MKTKIFTKLIFAICFLPVITSNAQLSFTESDQAFGSSFINSITFGDLNSDGFQDAIVTYSADTTEVWLNDKYGRLIDNGQRLFSEGIGAASSVAFGDIDGDGDLDAIIIYANELGGGKPDEVWLNNGNGIFEDSGQRLGKRNGTGAALADLDGDGDLDLFICNHTGGGASAGSQVWLNDGTGRFDNNGQELGALNQNHLSLNLGDIDSDGDIDAIVTSGWSPTSDKNEIWLNSGNGQFIGNLLSTSNSSDAAFGDLDNDGDLDLLIGYETGSKFLTNDSKGIFTLSNQDFGNTDHSGIDLGDLDNDGDLDAIIKGDYCGIWTNNGAGAFSESDLKPAYGRGGSIKLVDINNNGHLDVLAGNKIYINNDASVNNAPAAPTGLKAEMVSDTTVVLSWNRASDDHTPSKGLNYNLFVIKNGETNYKRPPLADTISGLRMIDEKGMAQDTFCILKNLNEGTYLWGVQAIDGSYKGGLFAKSTFYFTGTNIKSYKKLNSIIYPNPTKGYFTLVSGSTNSNNITAEIYNLQGKLVFTKNFHGNKQADFDLTGYSKGIYIIKTIADEITCYNKVCVE